MKPSRWPSSPASVSPSDAWSTCVWAASPVPSSSPSASPPSSIMVEPASKILAGRLAKGPWACFLLAIGCGFIMTTAVEFARKGKMLPLILGVPVFILCGFAHSIADAFYFLVSPAGQLLQSDVLIVYISEVLGNFVGCNLYRWILFFKPDNE